MRDPMNSASVSIYNVRHENVSDRPNRALNDLLNNTKIHMFEQPNMGALRQERNQRDRAAMKVLSSLVPQVMTKQTPKDHEEVAAVCIQRHFRGYLARKKYTYLLYEQFEKDETERLERIKQQVEEGEIIIDNYQLKRGMEENDCLRRNKRKQENCSAVTIQRVWREYSEKVLNRIDGLKNGDSEKILTSADSDDFNTFAISPFHDDFYEEDMFQNHPPFKDNNVDDSNDQGSEGECQSCYSDSGSKPELSGSRLIPKYYENSDCVHLDKELPPPTTDWESIDDRLNSNDVKNTDAQYSPDPKVINRLSIGPDYLQLCFEDDNALSDDGDTHHEETEIKEYTIEAYHSTPEHEERGDSVCNVRNDSLNPEPLDVKIIKPEELENAEISAEETSHVLLQLESVDEPMIEENNFDVLRTKFERFSFRHLETQVRDLKLKVKEVSDELVKELLIRDQLHTKQDALLMDVEDAVKYAQTKHKLSKKL